MRRPTELDQAEIRLEFRRLYKDLGWAGCVQVLYELLISSQILADVVSEEMKREREEKEAEDGTDLES